MRWLALLLVMAAVADAQPRFWRFSQRTEPGRSSRGFDANAYAQFEFAPASGAGMTSACSATAPVGAKGEALIFTRASNATCTKGVAGGLRTSGIADGDLVVLGPDQVRVEYLSTGVLGIRASVAGVQLLTYFMDLTNAAWSDLGTPGLTGGQVSPFATTYATSAVQMDDNDAAAFEGRSQSVTVSAGSAYTAHCYVKGGTLTSASISLDGTVASATGLSTTTWSIIEVTDASASGASIAFQVRNGSVASDTGTVIWGGCQVEAGSHRTSIIPRPDATAASRASDVGARFALTGVTTTMSMAATVETTYAQTTTGPQWLSLETVYGEATPKALGYSNAGIATTFIAGAFLSTSTAWTAGVHRFSADTGRNARIDSTTTATAAVTLSAQPNFVVITGNAAAGIPADGIYSQICVDPSETRCR